MALDRTNLIALAKATAKASLNPSANFSYEGKNLTFEALNETFRKEMTSSSNLSKLVLMKFFLQELCRTTDSSQKLRHKHRETSLYSQQESVLNPELELRTTL